MRIRAITLVVLAMALMVAAVVSGCNRNKRTAMNHDKRRPTERTRRPAEVLSASTYRPPRSNAVVYAVQAPRAAPAYYAQATYTAPVAYSQPIDYSQSAPTAVQGHYPGYDPTVASDPYRIYGYSYSGAQQPLPAAPTPVYYQEQPRAYQPPDLAAARASLPPSTPPAHEGVRSRVPPIPELDPVQRRLPVERAHTRPVAEVIMSTASDQSETERALEPIGPGANSSPEWLPSPITAMRY